MATIGSEIVEETRENISLKTGTKKKSWLNFTCKEDCFGGSRLITLSFTGLTIAITISLIIQIYYGDYQIVPHGSVATDSTECSEIGGELLKKGGNAVDAAIASTLCLAVVNPHNTGLDARGSMMIYSHRTRQIPQMIDYSNEVTVNVDNLPFTRLITGMVYAHLKYGKLPWRDVVKPAANIASQGFKVSTPLAQAVVKMKLEQLFQNYIAGKTVNSNALGSTLHQIADISEDRLKQYFSNINLENIQVNKSTFENHNIYVPDSPTIGPILLENLQEISNFAFTQNDISKPEFVYHIAKLSQKIYSEFEIDKNYHEGPSSNVAVVDTDDLYVSGVSGLYELFGTQEFTPSGYILDRNTSFNTNTRIPIIITDKNYICGRRIVMGAGDISIASQIITYLLLGHENATTSVEGPRFQMINRDIIGLESSRKVGFNDAVSTYLESFIKIEALSEPYSSCNIVEKIRDDLSSHSDSRGDGLSYRF